jgi:mannosyltransferase OCH1-like enzyme
MIPKIIHYCWFGGKPLPKSAIKCINSWKKFFPDYEIKEWNESNFDINMIPYTKEAYAAKKFAFVSDFARFWILHEHGGIYFDTDVEVIRSMDDIVAKGAFMGFEKQTSKKQLNHYIAPGLGIACSAKHPLWHQIIDCYSAYTSFDMNTGTVCNIVSRILLSEGASLSGNKETVHNVHLYPADYFCPQAMMGAPIEITENTRSIHHFDGTWLPWWKKGLVQMKQKIKQITSSRYDS